MPVIVSCATMSPIVTMSMIDTLRWQPVVYADSAYSKANFQSFLRKQKQSKDTRKTVLFLFGASFFDEVKEHEKEFTTIIVFDDVHNLNALAEAVPGLDVIDITTDEKGDVVPKQLTPQELMEAVEGRNTIEIPILQGLASAMAKHKPSVLENTSRLPKVKKIPPSDSQLMMTEVLQALQEGDPEFTVLLDVYVKYIFGIVNRQYVTSMVTKKIRSDSARDIWKDVLTYADGPDGLTIAKAFALMCRNDDPDYRTQHAAKDAGDISVSPDLLYFTSIIAPYKACVFVNPKVIDFLVSRN